MYPQIEADLKTALLAHDKATVDTLKLLKSALTNKKIELRKELTDEDILAVIRSEAKKRLEAKEMFASGGRHESAEKEANELEILRAYLPSQLDDEQLNNLVKTVKTELGDVHMGQLIAEVIKRGNAQVDGKRVAEAVRNSL